MQLLWGRGCPASFYGFDALPLFVWWRPAKGSFPLCRRCLALRLGFSFCPAMAKLRQTSPKRSTLLIVSIISLFYLSNLFLNSPPSAPPPPPPPYLT